MTIDRQVPRRAQHVGDRFSVELRKRREWWQLWRPKWSLVTRDYVVTHAADGMVAFERARA